MDINPRSLWQNTDSVGRRADFFPPQCQDAHVIVDLEPWKLVRRDVLILLLRSIVE
jgi:hypothetical protein